VVADHAELNYCPQCGEPLQDRPAYGRLRRYCASCHRVIFRDPKVAAGVLVERDDRVLLIRRATGLRRGLWSIPAGFVEHDEDPAITAVRECLEETGLSVTLIDLLDVIPGEGLPGEASFLIVYRAQAVDGSPQAGDDADQAAFFSPEELPPLAFASTRRALARWRERRGESSPEHR
jgi:ADP-ribose pyrophosphatase YjhB (NUDIX family)